jgi:hypothetical protein
MKYYKTFDEVMKVRIDVENNKSFSKSEGKPEVELPQHTTLVADAVIANDQISKEEYNA